MKVVAYSIKEFEKDFLERSNQKKHSITLITEPLSLKTISKAQGHEAVMVFTNDDVSAPVINQLADMGIKFIATRSAGMDHIDKKAAEERGIKLANVPVYSPHAIAEHAVALALSLNRHLIPANTHSHDFDFKLDGLLGFTFYGKTVGIMGLGHIGQAVAAIFNGFGCRVIGYDIKVPDNLIKVEVVSFEEVLKQSDIISLHLPLYPETKHIINSSTIEMMKDHVLLINTSRGGLINTEDALKALENGKIGHLGMDVYEYERGLFFEDHQDDSYKDPLLLKLMTNPNVLVTPHQAFLTTEALQQITDQTIKNLDGWEALL